YGEPKNSTFWEPIHEFYGTFDGNGKTLNYFTMNNFHENQEGGSFGFIGTLKNGATVKNLAVTEGSVEVSGGIWAGGLVGHNQGTIKQCSFNGSITTADHYNSTERLSLGGLVGYNEGIVEDCTSAGTVSTSNVFNRQGQLDIGGLVGKNNNLIQISENKAKVLAGSRIGAIFNGANVGGIAGSNQQSGRIISC
ncbi:MAG: GLUG motif-containing protein, partial [Eubacterium sp.]